MKTAFEKIWKNGETPESALGYVQARVQPKLTRYLERTSRRFAAR
jgi:hypothetical protein